MATSSCFAAFLILALGQALGIDSVVAFVIAVPIMFAVGYGLQAILLNRTLGLDILPPLLVTFGLSIIIQNGLLEAFSADTRRLQVGGVEIDVAVARRRHRRSASCRSSASPRRSS